MFRHYVVDAVNGAKFMGFMWSKTERKFDDEDGIPCICDRSKQWCVGVGGNPATADENQTGLFWRHRQELERFFDINNGNRRIVLQQTGFDTTRSE